MSIFRAGVGPARVAALGIVCAGLLSGCMAEEDYIVAMHRPSDGAKLFCDGGVYGVFLFWSGEAEARRIGNACVLACRRHGFIEDGAPTAIDPAEARLTPEEGTANTPQACWD